ncbi:hypothetical protein BN14_01468 [Rhizoctonia solani AG-1 IB]|uniref:Uncharacterized protein n=1 Tax=Thanatephorus cucumeris (strain AG1-IB / isolate 7/3/14) TaxID=1108050 RepID=M5BKY4_THACB|nr:hypothetical protein BN14_01468 [Rhizoctonia solani AG-1 IB]
MASAIKSTTTTTQTATTVAATDVALAAAQPLLLNFNALPIWMQDNAFILSGYRRPQYSWSGCARSVFGYLHNESGFSLALLAGVFCLGASALYHTSTCHSPAVSRRCNALDYSGIIVLTVGSFYPCLHYGFYCDYHLQVIYSVGITVAGCIAAYVVLNPVYGTPAYRWARTTVFFLLGICALVPVTHAYLIYGLERMQNEMGVNWIALTGTLYASGALI